MWGGGDAGFHTWGHATVVARPPTGACTHIFSPSFRSDIHTFCRPTDAGCAHDGMVKPKSAILEDRVMQRSKRRVYSSVVEDAPLAKKRRRKAYAQRW